MISRSRRCLSGLVLLLFFLHLIIGPSHIETETPGQRLFGDPGQLPTMETELERLLHTSRAFSNHDEETGSQQEFSMFTTTESSQSRYALPEAGTPLYRWGTCNIA